MTAEKRDQWLSEYWAAQAQFGPLDVGPDEYLAFREQSEASD